MWLSWSWRVLVGPSRGPLKDSWAGRGNVARWGSGDGSTGRGGGSWGVLCGDVRCGGGEGGK